MRQPYAVRIHCEDITPGASGGIENFATGMIQGFAETIGADRLVVLVRAGSEADWAARLSPDVRLSGLSPLGSPANHARSRLVRRLLRRSALAARGRAHLRSRSSGGSEDSMVADYFPYHRALTYGGRRFVTVHDLRVFSAEFTDRPSQRNITANVASARAVFASWRNPFLELSTRFPEAAPKLHEVPFPPMLAPTSSTRSPGDFLLYPAATTPHKNHRLLVRYLAGRSDAPPIVCVGPEVEPGLSELRTMASAEGVRDRIRFLGMVPSEQLNDLYAGCWAVVMPTLHEAASGPVMEAFARGVPVVAADIPALRDQMAQCGADVSWFDPYSTAALDKAVHGLRAAYPRLTDAARAGGDWYARLSWTRTAADYVRVMDAAMAEP